MDFDPSSQEGDLEVKVVHDEPRAGPLVAAWDLAHVKVAEAKSACSELVEGIGVSETLTQGCQSWEIGYLQPWGCSGRGERPPAALAP